MLSRCTRVLHRAARRMPRRHLSTLADSSESVQEQFDPANPRAEHRALRKMVQEFTKNEVEPQALQYNREERFNRALFERAGELGLLGVTADPEYGGAGMDATAACIVHEVPYDPPSCHDAGVRRLSPDARALQELSYSDPAFCLSYLAHSQLFVNNLARNGTAAQARLRGAAHLGLARLSYHGFGVPPIVASTHSHAMHETVAVGAVAAACVLGRAHRRHGNERAELRHGRACHAHHRANAGRSGRGRHAHVARAPRLGACLLRGEGRPLAGCTSRATPRLAPPRRERSPTAASS